jgi:hypothetical protein
MNSKTNKRQIASRHPFILNHRVQRFLESVKFMHPLDYLPSLAATLTFPTSTTMKPSSFAPTGAPNCPAQLALTFKRTLAPEGPEPAVKRPFCSSQSVCGVDVRTSSLPTVKVTLHLDRVSSCLTSALSSYCRPGQTVRGCARVRLRPG